MQLLQSCGYLWFFLSIWAIIQLGIMGALFKSETLNFIEAAIPEEYTDYDDFIARTSANYQQIAYNCWFAAGMYVVVMVMSYGCVWYGKKSSEKKINAAKDESVVCGPPVDLSD